MNDPNSQNELHELLALLRRRLRAQTVAIWLMSLMLVLTLAAVFGDLVNYFAGDAMLFGGVTAGAAVLGFVFGLIAGRRA